jgi:hypothetical protein
MSIFGNLFKRKPALVVKDPAFGPLTHDQGIWTFTPKRPGPGFMITIAAPQTGPTPEQRDFFERVRPKLADLHLRARDFIRSRADEPVNLSRLSLYSVETGDEEETKRREFVLELSDEDAIVNHRVSFRADEPVDYGFDD